jgi:hypothetical protein
MIWIDVRSWSPQIFTPVLLLIRAPHGDIIMQGMIDENDIWFYECPDFESNYSADTTPRSRLKSLDFLATHWTLLPDRPPRR